MKYIIEKLEEKTSGRGTKYYVLELKDESGIITSRVSTFDSGLAEGGEVEGEIVQNGDFLNFKSAKAQAKGNFNVKAKEEAINHVMERKEKAISAAQDRTAWMWAKNNACILIANNDQYKNLKMEAQLLLINQMATDIYGQDVGVPF